MILSRYELTVLFIYVIPGLLTNFGTLGLDRMHNLLRVFVVGEPKYAGKTQEQLAAFLQVLVVQEKIELQNGVYSKQRAAAAP
jgi:anaphase-promoting complex subunit 2